MLRQVNETHQVTIPAPIAKRLGVGGKSWVDLAEKNGVVVLTPVHVRVEGAAALRLSGKDWRALNRKVRQELREGKGVVHQDRQSFLRDLKRRMTSA
jgi:bifunctional DNA-binding transcriptional regulator/antitoxin component of YhaV-PrlF toxin-antitoxin module